MESLFTDNPHFHIAHTDKMVSLLTNLFTLLLGVLVVNEESAEEQTTSIHESF